MQFNLLIGNTAVKTQRGQ